MAKIILKSGKERSIERFHPWLFSGAIKNTEGEIKEGDIVEIFDNKATYLATGHYQIGSIAVRIFSFKQTETDRKFWKDKIASAYELRQKLGFTDNPHTNVYRLINGEGDGLPGLIMDYYNGVIVMQCHSIGMYFLKELFAELLKEIYGNSLLAVYDKSKETIPFKSGINPENQYLFGNTVNDISVLENGLKYNIDFREGQKTGFFIDQRDNRQLLGTYAEGKNVLNAFCYTGGFSIAALKGKARHVVSIDSSQKAMNTLEKNVELNFGKTDNHESKTDDFFSFMQTIGNTFDLIILDPPAFGKHQDVLENALKGYRNLNKKALEKIKPGGIIFTFSCSQIVSRDNFSTAIFSAAALAKRNVRILHRLSQPSDHPVSIFHPEGEYLKGLVLYVE